MSLRNDIENAVSGDAEDSSDVQKWLDHIATYDREFKKWGSRVEKILKRYRDDARNMRDASVKFNVLWSNVQTLVPATFSRLPKPDVTRRFRDNDPVGRVASLILERALDYEIEHYPDYRSTLSADIHDRFLGGRGTAWVRYEPHMKAAEQALPVDGSQVTDDIDEPGEELDYECSPVDYVHWRDFGHTLARTWEETTGVWRIVYLDKAQATERFGEEIAARLPYDSAPQDLKKGDEQKVNLSRAKVYEIWDKEKLEAKWLCKGVARWLDVRPDPLGLEGFYPCPKPLYATLTNDSLVPVPDFTLYQDQANELDVLADRIDGLVKALQVKGVHDGAIPELARLFTEGQNGDMIPVKNWAAFSEKAGLKGAIDLVDLAPIAAALQSAYMAMDQIKQQVYEITGISDIVRGQTDAGETATAQQIKGQYASLRLRSYQQEVARFATDLLRLKAQIICGQFAPQTIAQMAAVEQLAEQDKQYIGPALELLIGERLQNPDAKGKNPLRSFRIEIAADTLVQIDEQAEKEARVEFLTATGSFLEKAVQAAQVAPQMVPLLMEMLKWGVTGFKVGKSIEGAFDEATQQLTQAAQQPQPPTPDPTETVKAQATQAKAQAEMVRAQADQQIAPINAQAEMVKAQAGVIAASENARQARLQAALPPQ